MENMPPSNRAGFPTSRQANPSANAKSSPIRQSTANILSSRANSRNLFETGLLTPQPSYQAMQLDAASTLISPPPEDNFRQGARSQSRFGSEPAQSRYSPGEPSQPNAVAGSSTKRKRSAAPSNANLRAAAIAEEDESTAFVNASPNPKARKQKRRSASPVSPRPTSPQHPHSVQRSPPRARASAHPATTPLQNPALARVRQGSRARSSTPVPVYEPPTERFTPPREVVLTPSPRISKSSKRKSVGKAPRLKLVIKKELPEIDLSKPAPPPSPTDDPLLLHGRPRTSKTPAKARVTPPLESSPPERAMPPPPPRHLDFSVPASDDLPRYEAPQTEVVEEHNDLPDEQDDLPDPGPVFDFSNAGGADDGWSSSDNEPERDAFDGTGEFTGKFRMMSVPTKVDPPTSATRERIESWGRPISPFPKKWKGKEKMVVEEDEAEDEVFGGLDEDTEMTDEMDGGEPDASADRADDGDNHEEEPPQDEGSDGIEEPASPPRHSASPAPPARFSTSPRRSSRPSASPQRSHSPVQQRSSPSPSLAHKSPSPSIPPASPTVEGSPDEDEDDVPVASFDHVERTASPPAQPGSPDHPHDSGFEEGNQGENSSQDRRRPVHMDSSPIREASPLPPPTVARTSPIPVTREKSVEEEEMEEELSVDRELSEEPQPDREVDEHGLRLTDEIMFKAEHDLHHDEPFSAVVDDLDEEDTSDEDPGDLSVVKIVSDDPWAAARAAAILKSHDYDWHTKIERPRRRQSSVRSPSVDSRIRNARRASAVGAGIAKFSSPAEKAQRRNTLAIGLEKTVTLPELLQKAEADIICSSPAHDTPARSSIFHRPQDFRTPSPAYSAVSQRVAPEPYASLPPPNTRGPRSWDKNDWKLLDACFTDERLDMAGENDILGDVDAVDVGKVVGRFVDVMGGWRVIEALGEEWDRHDLLARTRALQKKQRAGRIAPPTPSTRSASASPSLFVPEFTPVPVHVRRAPFASTSALPRLPAPFTVDGEKGKEKAHVPSTLLAPRYSHIMDEVIAISKPSPPAQNSVPSSSSLMPPPSSPAPAYNPPASERHTTPLRPKAISTRVKGFFFSYLPTMSKPKPAPNPEERRPGLPLPPPEVLEKPRGPIDTPQSKPAPRPAHPKELVNLHPAPAPSRLPRMTRKAPRRLVELRRVTPPEEEREKERRTREERRGSGSSVRDLVRSFEGLDEREREAVGRLVRKRSAGEMSVRSVGERPAWR